MRFFSCSICREKDERIADLKQQVANLMQLVSPQNANDPNRVPALNFEANAVLNGQQHIIEIDAEDVPADDADSVLAERDRLLSANF